MYTEEYVAKELMQIKSETGLMTFLTTFWLGDHVMIVWDKLNDGIMQIWSANDIPEEQVEILNNLVWSFLGEEE